MLEAASEDSNRRIPESSYVYVKFLEHFDIFGSLLVYISLYVFVHISLHMFMVMRVGMYVCMSVCQGP